MRENESVNKGLISKMCHIIYILFKDKSEIVQKKKGQMIRMVAIKENLRIGRECVQKQTTKISKWKLLLDILISQQWMTSIKSPKQKNAGNCAGEKR